MRHLQRLQGSRSSTGHLPDTATKSGEVSGENRWLSGFGHCAAEAYRFLSAVPGEGAERLARHLAAGLQKSRQTNSTVIISSSSIEETKVTLSLPDTIIRGSSTLDWRVAPSSPLVSVEIERMMSPNSSNFWKFLFLPLFLSRSFFKTYLIRNWNIFKTTFFFARWFF